MEWKWIKSFLIVIFVLLNCFLGYKLYIRNQILNINTDAVNSINTILASRNIKCEADLTKISVKSYMRKIRISNSETVELKFIPENSIDEKKDLYTGRNRELLSLSIVIANLLRNSKFENAIITNIVFGYYPEMSQIDKTVLSGEATPAWLIETDNGKEYIYNAYLGEEMAILDTNMQQ